MESPNENHDANFTKRHRFSALEPGPTVIRQRELGVAQPSVTVARVLPCSLFTRFRRPGFNGYPYSRNEPGVASQFYRDSMELGYGAQIRKPQSTGTFERTHADERR